jgi:hypothetical protein
MIDLALRPFGPHLIIEPRSEKGRRFAERRLAAFRYSNGVYSASTEEQCRKLGAEIKRSKLEVKVA